MSYVAPYVLIIDIGSSSVKASIYDSTASVVGHTQVSISHGQRTGVDGMHEEDADDILSVVNKAVDDALTSDAVASKQIVAVGMDTMASTILGVDSSFQPVTPVYTYADTRSAKDVERLREMIDVDAAYDRTGVMQHTSYVPGRVMWLRRTNPHVFSRVAKWVDISTYIYSRWFGLSDVPTSYSVASWSGLLDRRELNWDDGLLDAISLSDDFLPSLAPYSHSLRGLCKEYAARWAQLSDVPFMLSVGDGAAVNVGTGCIDDRRVALTVGTTGAMRLIAEDVAGVGPPLVPRGLWGYRLGSDHTLLGGAFSEGGNVVQWAQQALNIPSLDSLNDALSDSEPDGHGLTVLPFIAGERAVGWSTNASCAFDGVRISTTGLDMLQAIMESVAYRFSLVSDLLAEHMDDDHVFVAGGGGMTNSTWWLQTVSDVLQSEVLAPKDEQGTSRGAAILALNAIGVWEGLDDVSPDIAACYFPSDRYADVYVAAKERQQVLYSRLIN